MKRPKNDVVIDIETMGTEDDSVIVSIGAVVFNRADEPGTIISNFHVKVDTESQPNRSITAATMLWWMKDDMKSAREAAFGNNEVPKLRLGLALKKLEEFIVDSRPNEFWACSPDFDMGILSNAYKSFNVKFPGSFWQFRDIRTLESFLYGHGTRVKGKENFIDGVAHDALHDCLMEAKTVQNCYKMVKSLS